MPSGPRIRANNQFGLTSDNPLTDAAVSVNSAELADFPVVSSAHAVITLDPLKQFGEPELVVVTDHAGSSTTATITRGANGTVAREHPQGTTWVHAPINEDVIDVVTSSTHPSDPYEGQFIYETDTNFTLYYDGAAWIKINGSPQTLGYAELTATQGGITSEVDLNGMSVTVTVPEGRRLRITGLTPNVVSTVTNDTFGLRIKESATTLNVSVSALSSAAGNAGLNIAQAVITPTAGTHTYKLSGARINGSGSITVNTTLPGNPSFILVEDITGDPLPYDPASVPVGQLGYAEVTADQTGITTEVNLTGLSVNVNVPDGRVIRITGTILSESSVNDDRAGLRIKEGGTQLQQSTNTCTPGNISQEHSVSVVVSPTAGSHTYNLALLRTGGSGNIAMRASATSPAYILVEDITPTPAPANGAPASTLGYAQVTANQGSITTITDLTGLTTTVTVPAGRRIKVTAECNAQSNNAGSRIDLAITDAANNIFQLRSLDVAGTNTNSMMHAEVILTPAAGTHTFKARMQDGAAVGTVTMAATATTPAFILVEDITGAVFPQGSDISVGMIAPEPWTDYVPANTNVTVGNGTQTARYSRIGNTVHVAYTLSFGTTTSFGGTVQIGLPFPAAATTTPRYLGSAWMAETGVANHVGSSLMISASQVRIQSNNAATQVTASVPFSWGNLDELSFSMTYEAA